LAENALKHPSLSSCQATMVLILSSRRRWTRKLKAVDRTTANFFSLTISYETQCFPNRCASRLGRFNMYGLGMKTDWDDVKVLWADTASKVCSRARVTQRNDDFKASVTWRIFQLQGLASF